MDAKERFIYEEMQSLRQVGFRLLQNGIALLAGIELALVIIRQRSAERVAAGSGGKGDLVVPLQRHAMGTALQLSVATTLALPTILVARRYRFYRDLLKREGESALPVPAGTSGADGLIGAAFLLFPAMDFLAWPYRRSTTASR